MTSRWTYLSAALVGGSMLIGQTALQAQVGPGAAKAKAKEQPKAAPKSATPAPPKPAANDQRDDVKKDAKKEVREDAKDARENAKDRTKDTREDAKDRTKDARDDAKDRTKDARDDAKDTVRKPDAGRDRDDVKDRAKDTKETAKDRAKDTKETAKDRTKDAKETAKDRADDAKDVAKDRTGDAKDTAKSGKQARKFDVEKVKADDLGLSFKDADDGIAISNVSKDSVFTKAGFQSGDQIVSVGGQNVTRQQDFVSYLFGSNVNSNRVPVILLRNGSRQTVYVQPATIIRNYETVVYQGRSNPIRDFGLVVDGRSDDRVYVERVIKDSRADQAGIQVDDEILAVNEQPVETSKDLSRLLEKYEEERIDMEVNRERQAKTIEVRVVR